MNEYYRILGLDESASDEEIEERYLALKRKYSEDRWLEGEEGNEAARNLGRLETAYMEITRARRESRYSSGKSLLEEAEEAIRAGDLVKAQNKLDECNERNGEWHYLQAILFYRKNWTNESKKQLEIALQLEPDNQKFKDAYDRMQKRTEYQSQSAYQGAGEGGAQEAQAQSGDQMGGNGCSQCIDCCYTYMCVNCLFNLCCNCR